MAQRSLTPVEQQKRGRESSRRQEQSVTGGARDPAELKPRFHWRFAYSGALACGPASPTGTFCKRFSRRSCWALAHSSSFWLATSSTLLLSLLRHGRSAPARSSSCSSTSCPPSWSSPFRYRRWLGLCWG